MRILFAGTPEIAVPSLIKLNNQSYITAVLSSPDAPKGRSRKPCASPIKSLALELGLPVLTPEKLDTSARAQIAGFGPDLLVVVAYGKIFGPRFLELFPQGGINLHPSLLPLHRGPSPIPYTILAGDTEWGLTVQQVALKMDAGDILVQRSFTCSGTETTSLLFEKAAEIGADAVLQAVQAIESGTADPVPQNHSQASYSRMISKSDGQIEWNNSAETVHRMIRAYNPWPGGYTFLAEKKLTIWEAEIIEQITPSVRPGEVVSVDSGKGILVQTGKGLLAIRSLQLEGKKRLSWKEFINGIRNLEGVILGGSNA